MPPDPLEGMAEEGQGGGTQVTRVTPQAVPDLMIKPALKRLIKPALNRCTWHEDQLQCSPAAARAVHLACSQQLFDREPSLCMTGARIVLAVYCTPRPADWSSLRLQYPTAVSAAHSRTWLWQVGGKLSDQLATGLLLALDDMPFDNGKHNPLGAICCQR